MPNAWVPWTIKTVSKALPRDEVHVYLAEQSMFQTMVSDLRALLTIEETQRAARFYFEKDRRRFIIARSLLRMLLTNYTRVPAVQINLSYNAYGKPELASSPHRENLSFNLSHSHDLIVYAFTYGRRLGIDIEYRRVNIEYEQLAQHYFSPAENAELQHVPFAMRRQAFFDCWTRKEAYIKARGLGLSLPLDSFDVTVEPNAPIALLANREDAQETGRWLFAPLPTIPTVADYSGTLVVEGRDWRMHCWQLLPSTT